MFFFESFPKTINSRSICPHFGGWGVFCHFDGSALLRLSPPPPPQVRLVHYASAGPTDGAHLTCFVLFTHLFCTLKKLNSDKCFTQANWIFANWIFAKLNICSPWDIWSYEDMTWKKCKIQDKDSLRTLPKNNLNSQKKSQSDFVPIPTLTTFAIRAIFCTFVFFKNKACICVFSYKHDDICVCCTVN